jgi:hypothetical protein
MSLFNNTFGSRPKEILKEKRQPTLKDIEKAYTPCKKIGSQILGASNECYQIIKSDINITNEKQKKFAEIMIFYEFIFFYIHVTMKYASIVMTKEQLIKLWQYLTPFFVSAAVEAFFMQWPQERKEKISAFFYNRLNTAEIEYATAKGIIAKTGLFEENTLCYKLGLRVAEWSNNSFDPVSIFQLSTMAVAELKKIKLIKLVTEAANTL